MARMIKRQLLWIIYGISMLLAVLFGGDGSFPGYDGPMAGGQVLLLVIFAGFLAYSLYCGRKESFIRVLPKINQYHWGRQIGLDLYISVFMSLILIWLVEGSVVVLLAWLVPVVLFANLAILPWMILNYGSLVSLFS